MSLGRCYPHRGREHLAESSVLHRPEAGNHPAFLHRHSPSCKLLVLQAGMLSILFSQPVIQTGCIFDRSVPLQRMVSF